MTTPPTDHRLAAADGLRCDVLIIGSGAGGASAADVMIGAGRDTLILEEGPFIDHAHVPAKTTEAFLQMWRGAGLTPAFGAPPVSYAEGRCVGGGTEINSAIFQRTPDEVVEEWRETFQIDDFGPDILKPYYDRAAEVVNASITPGPLGPPSDLLRKGGQALGWKVSALERGQRSCVGTNLCSFGCPTGGKQSMTATLIPKALAGGARLISDCRVSKLIFEGDRVVGARAQATLKNGRKARIEIRADQVIVAGGAIQTPALLQRSGLKAQIGRNLHLHPTIKALALFDEPTRAEQSRLPLYAITEFMPDIRLGGSVSRPGVTAMAIAEDWDARRDLLPAQDRLGAYYAMIRARGVGQVRATAFGADPLVQYALTDGDWDLLRRGLGYLAQALFAAGASRVVPSLQGHAGWSSAQAADAELTAPLPRTRANLMTIHLFSTCPIGEAPDKCPVDSFGKVRQVRGLHLADASLIPTASGVNPQGTVMALAFRSAEHALRANA